MDLAALTLFGRARYRVLACLFALDVAEALHLREIARRADLSPTATQYELRRLLAAGLVVQAGPAARPLYAANAKHPVAGELREMLRKLDAAREPAGRSGAITPRAAARASPLSSPTAGSPRPSARTCART